MSAGPGGPTRASGVELCPDCGIEKTDANSGRRSDNGKLRAHCKACRCVREAKNRAGASAAVREQRRQKQHEYSRRHYSRHRQNEIERSRRYNLAHEDKCLDSHLRRTFGITLDQYKAMLERQGGVCAVCQRPEDATVKRTAKTRRLHVDHCHRSGRVRGLLCTRCNMGLGYMRDDPEIIVRLLAYLKRALALVRRATPTTQLALFDADRAKMRMRGDAWSEAQIAFLADAYQAAHASETKVDLLAVAETIGRSAGACSAKAHKLGLIKRGADTAARTE